MIYRVDASFLFNVEDEAKDFYHDCEVAMPKATFINPCQPNHEFSSAQLQECRHDEAPLVECTLLEHIDNKPECPPD